MKKKIAIVSTHPIQYNAPLFKLLAASCKIDIHVFYTWSQTQAGVKDPYFKQSIIWDIPLLDGYSYTFIENISKHPKQQFNGLINPNLIPSIEQWAPDIIWVFGWNFQSHFKVMRYFKNKIPVWFRGDSTLLNTKPNLKGVARYLLLKWVYSYVDKAFYVGTNNRYYFEKYGLTEAQLLFAPHAIDNSRFGGDEVEKKSLIWRRELGYADDEIVIVYAGKFIECKGLLPFVSQFKNYTSKYPLSKLRMLLIGNGPLASDLQSIQNEKIKLLPFQNQSRMPYIYCIGNIFALPSNSETWGLGINEAMASGRAVIVTNKVGCAIDLVEDGVNGFYFDLKDPDKNIIMFQKIEQCNLKEMGLVGRRRISKWSFKTVIESIETAAYEK